LKKRQYTAIILIAGIITGMAAMWIVTSCVGGFIRVNAANYENMLKIYNKYSKLEQIYSYIDANYYKDTDDDKLMEGIYSGLVEALDDPYSSYMSSDKYEEWSSDVSGEFGGIGVTFTKNDNGEFLIVSVIDDTPAYKAGLRAGDIIEAVDGKTYDDMNDIVAVIRGEEGTSLKLRYKRDDTEKTVTIIRDTIQIESVKSEIRKDNIGYIRISSFIETTSEDFKDALSKMENADVDGMVIDIRNNGGGLVDQGLDVADELLGKCTLVCYVDNKGNKTYSYSDKDKTDIPYVLLVDGATASTSEILTAAVKDNNGGKIVGTKTFGKGIIQNTSKFKDGSALKLTVMQYLSPNGNEIHNKGIKPDYVVKLKKNDDTDYQLNKAVKLLKQE
jgi:carboxyl-terminal processing protease